MLIAMRMAPARSAGLPGRTLATLVVLAVALCFAFVLGPITLAATSADHFADQRDIATHLRDTFVGYWQSGRRDFPRDLAGIVQYWSYYHVAKGAIAALLAVVFVMLAVALWRAFLRAEGAGAARMAALAVSGVLAMLLVLGSSVIVLANIQGAMAPFASLLSMLPTAPPDPQLADTAQQISGQLAHYPGAGGSPALAVMLSDYVRYHAVLAVTATIMTFVLVGLCVASWRWFATSGPATRTRRVAALFGVLSVVAALAMIVAAVANMTTVASPVPGLQAVFTGGW